MDLLTPAQKLRVAQIKLRLRSAEVFFYREILDKLQVTRDQKLEFERFRNEIGEKTGVIRLQRKQGELKPPAAAARIDEILDSYFRQLVSTLDERQQASLNALLGKPIEFKRSDVQMILKRR